MVVMVCFQGIKTPLHNYSGNEESNNIAINLSFDEHGNQIEIAFDYSNTTTYFLGASCLIVCTICLVKKVKTNLTRDAAQSQYST